MKSRSRRSRQETPASERRRSARVQPQLLSAVLHASDAEEVVSVRDISHYGLRVVNAPSFLKTDDRFDLTVYSGGGQSLKVECRVVHVSGKLAHSVVGAEFVSPDEKSISGLLSALSEATTPTEGDPQRRAA